MTLQTNQDFSSVFDLIPFSCFIATKKRIEKINSASKTLGLKKGLLEEQVGSEISMAIFSACEDSKTISIPEYNIIFGEKERFFNVTVTPLKSGEESTAIVFLDEVTHLFETSNELALSLIETEVANRNLGRTISVLAVLARFSAELLKISQPEDALDILERGLEKTTLFEDVWLVLADGSGIDNLPEEIRGAAKDAIESGNIWARLPKPFLIIPINGRDKFYGIVCACLKKEGVEDINIDLKPFATMTAFTLDNIALYNELISNMNALSLRNRALRTLQESHTLGEIESGIFELLKEYFEISRLRIFRSNSKIDFSKEFKLLIHSAFQGIVEEGYAGGGAALCLPIRIHEPARIEDIVHSVMLVYSETKERFSDIEKELLISLSDLIGISLSKIQIYDDLRAHSVAVQYLNEELNRSIIELKAANEMKSRFVSTVSHEFRTPLTAISSYVQTLFENFESIDIETAKSFLGVVREETDRLTRLINQLLDLSRIQARDRPLSNNPLSMFELAQKIVETLKPVADSKSLKIEIDKGSSKGDVVGDEDALKQVLLNLTGNSIRYTMPGGIVEIRVEEDDKMVYTHVKDTGIGIPQDSLDAIFSEFYTVTQTRASLARESGNSEVEKEILGAEGTGLGLSIAKAIVERHGGVIRVKSKVGIGSEFIVALQRRGGDS